MVKLIDPYFGSFFNELSTKSSYIKNIFALARRFAQLLKGETKCYFMSFNFLKMIHSITLTSDIIFQKIFYQFFTEFIE